MLNRFSRSEMLFGVDTIEALKNSRVAVFGVGGVGGYVVEALARSGVGAIDVVDDDKIALTNINRQILALTSTVGQDKVDVAEERIRDINPDCKVIKHKCFYLPETSGQFDFKEYNYIVDAIDTVTGKIEIIIQAGKANVPVISSMGTGNKLDPTAFKVADIYLTKVCPLAKRIRKLCKDNGIEKLKVVYSEEEPLIPFKADDIEDFNKSNRSTPGSNAFVPAVAGLIIAGEVIKDLIKIKRSDK